MLTTQMDGMRNQFDVKNKEGIKSQLRKHNFTQEESIHGIWDDILEKIPKWDDELILEKNKR